MKKYIIQIRFWPAGGWIAVFSFSSGELTSLRHTIFVVFALPSLPATLTRTAAEDELGRGFKVREELMLQLAVLLISEKG